jgi:hypothetical protein
LNPEPVNAYSYLNTKERSAFQEIVLLLGGLEEKGVECLE